MKKTIVSIRDVKTGEYLSLVLVKNHLEAKRAFLGLVHEPKSPLYRFPRDYHLHVIGEFNMLLGGITGTEHIEDITPYAEVDELVLKRERLDVEDFKSAEYFRKLDAPS